MIYGTVRFHHRPVREYLAAEWLAELLKRPASRRSIEALLFRNQYGLDVIVPTTRPVLPWLAILDEPIRERLRKVAPEVLFEGGDPSALPLPTRRIILSEVCEQIASDGAGMDATSYAAVCGAKKVRGKKPREVEGIPANASRRDQEPGLPGPYGDFAIAMVSAQPCPGDQRRSYGLDGDAMAGTCS